MDNLEDKNEEAGNPNPQDGDDLTPEKAKRYKEQIAGSKAEAERLRILAKEVVKATVDSNSLLELYKKDPNMADEVAKEFGYDDYDDIKQKYYPEEEKPKNGFTEDDIERILSERESKKEHEKAITKAKTVIGKLDESLQEKAQGYFNKMTKGQKLDEESALEFAEMATLYVNRGKNKSDKKSEGLAMLGSTGISNSKGGDDSPQYVVVGGKLVLLTNK